MAFGPFCNQASSACWGWRIWGSSSFGFAAIQEEASSIVEEGGCRRPSQRIPDETQSPTPPASPAWQVSGHPQQVSVALLRVVNRSDAMGRPEVELSYALFVSVGGNRQLVSQ
jgi:hypothetical protein